MTGQPQLIERTLKKESLIPELITPTLSSDSEVSPKRVDESFEVKAQKIEICTSQLRMSRSRAARALFGILTVLEESLKPKLKGPKLLEKLLR